MFKLNQLIMTYSTYEKLRKFKQCDGQQFHQYQQNQQSPPKMFFPITSWV